MVRKKRAVIGIGTLIIFIAMILVAAVAAGVIIRTSGILQERAFAVSGEARKRLVTGVEVLQVVGTSNVSASNIPKLEFYLRTRPGSRPVQLQTTGMTFSTQSIALSANLQHRLTESFNKDLTDNVNSSWVSFGYDMNGDQINEKYRVVNGSVDGVDDVGIFQFNVSGVSGSVNVSLGVNLSSTSERNVSLNEVPISKNDNIYGFVSVQGNMTEANILNASSLSTLKIRQFQEDTICNFDDLIPERFYCYESRLGDSDTVLEAGELYIVKFQLRPEDALSEEEVFQVNFIPKDGGITFLQASPPNVISDKKIILWPQ